jgi:hypothetical protein
MNAKKEAIAKAPESRVRRTPLGKRNVLTVAGKEPGYEYRIVNDVGDRIQEFLDNGWELVKKQDVRIGDKRLGPASSEDSTAKASVGRGMTGYVLRIREDWYKEDQAAKQEAVDATESAMKTDALNGNYGKLDISRG